MTAELKIAAQSNDENDLRAQCRDIAARESMTTRQLATECGVAYSTMTAWLAGTYAGRSDKVGDLVGRWLAARTEWRSAAGDMPTAPGYLTTPSATTFGGALRVAQALPDISAIVGAPGIGKTAACRRYQESNPNVTLITANPAVSGANTVLAAVAEALRLTERSSTRLYRAIGAKLAGGQPLIIIDEAQHLTLLAFEQLRALHDEYAIGLAFVGNEVIHGILSGGRNGSEHAQLSSRFGFRVVQRGVSDEDVQIILDGWEVEDEAARRYLASIAGKAGALRVMGKVIRLAWMLAQPTGRPPALVHYRAAYEQQTRSPGASA